MSDPIFATRDEATPNPTPTQARTIALFLEGKNTEQIALEMNVKHPTAQYVPCRPTSCLGISSMDADTQEVPGSGHWQDPRGRHE
jgi:hypothetical protein